MIETLIYAYLILGLIHALVIWYTSFQPDFDDFVRDEFNEEPPTTSEKWTVILLSPLAWPYFLWKSFT